MGVGGPVDLQDDAGEVVEARYPGSLRAGLAVGGLYHFGTRIVQRPDHRHPSITQ